MLTGMVTLYGLSPVCTVNSHAGNLWSFVVYHFS